MLWTRIATAAVGIPIVLTLIWVGGWPLILVVALVAALGLRELLRLAGLGPEVALLASAGAALGVIGDADPGAGFLVALALPWVLLVTALPYPFPRTAAAAWRWVSVSFGGLLYVAVPLAYLLRLRALSSEHVRHTPVPLGAALLFLAIGACWVMDAAAYLVGRKIGKHKLAPKISPGKTVEGSVAGLLGAVLFVGALGWWVGLPVWSAALLGVTLGVVGQLGDLFESWLKRRAGVKDSGALLPGHGGVLDRFDSLLFVAPVAYYWLRAALG